MVRASLARSPCVLRYGTTLACLCRYHIIRPIAGTALACAAAHAACMDRAMLRARNMPACMIRAMMHCRNGTALAVHDPCQRSARSTRHAMPCHGMPRACPPHVRPMHGSCHAMPPHAGPGARPPLVRPGCMPPQHVGCWRVGAPHGMALACHAPLRCTHHISAHHVGACTMLVHMT